MPTASDTNVQQKKINKRVKHTIFCGMHIREHFDPALYDNGHYTAQLGRPSTT